MARTSANFLVQAAALARMSALGPTSALDLGLTADQLANVLLDWNQGYEEAYGWRNTPWEDAWEDATITPGTNGLITYAQLSDAAQFCLWSADPRTDKTAAVLVYRSSTDGVHVPDWTSDVFAFFKPAAPVFTFAQWSNATAYTSGQIVLATDGQCYRALQSGTNENPTTATAYWRVIPVIGVLSKAVQLMALANKATRDGNHGEAAKMVRDAEDKLDDQAQLEFPRVSSWWWIRRQ
jgi:hypothetical protein